MQTINNYTYEEEQLIVKSATRRKELKRLDQIIKEKHFRIRNKSIQHYFIRLSCDNKKKFILRLMENITGLASVLQVLHVMSWSHTKMFQYSEVYPETNFVYDKLILDHNRMLDEKVLAETMDSDVAWFSTLEDDFQGSLIIDLIRISSGIVKRKLYLPIFQVYHKKLAEYRQIKWKTPEENVRGPVNSMQSNVLEDEDKYDPKHPATIEVEKQRRKWDEMITKYRAEVEGADKNITGNVKKEKKGKSVGKKSKTKKKTSKAKSEKSQKTKSKKGAKTDEIDVIQLMPIWIVKKIFGYLDQKALLSIKKVNRYWSYVVQEILKERKARENINKYLAKLEARIDPKKLEPILKSSSDGSPNRKLMHPHGIYYEMGAIPKNIVPRENKNLVDISLTSEALKEVEEAIAVPNGELVSFPRLIKQDIQLYRHHPCFIQDVNVIYDVDADIQRQRSFLTYSLTTVISTLKICVNEQDLSDW